MIAGFHQFLHQDLFVLLALVLVFSLFLTSQLQNMIILLTSSSSPQVTQLSFLQPFMEMQSSSAISLAHALQITVTSSIIVILSWHRPPRPLITNILTLSSFYFFYFPDPSLAMSLRGFEVIISRCKASSSSSVN